jgi:RHS repeat-associated protein
MVRDAYAVPGAGTPGPCFRDEGSSMVLQWLRKRVQRRQQTKSGRARGRKPSALRLEELEPRVLLSAADDRAVTRLYDDLLQRPVEPFGLSVWGGQLEHGASRLAVALGIARSPEYQALQVNGLYADYLHRSGDPQGLNAWLGILAGGGSLTDVRLGILASPEYAQARGGGGTPDGFLAALYHDVLGRPVDAAGQAAFSAVLAHGGSARAVAEAVWRSPEAARTFLQLGYRRYLDRDADAPGLDAGAAAVQAGLSEEGVVAGFAGSEEYAQQFVAAVPPPAVDRPAVAVPGTSGQAVTATFTLTGQDGVFAHELGAFRVDDAAGRIGDLRPGDPGYAAAALAADRRLVTFTPQQAPGAATTLPLPGGSFLGLYLVLNATVATLEARNPSNDLGSRPFAFFSFKSANPDRFEHVHELPGGQFAFKNLFAGAKGQFLPAGTDPAQGQFVYQDLFAGGDPDADDRVVQITFANSTGGGPTDQQPPTIAVALANDTGLSASDRITSDPSVAGSVTDASAIASFHAGLDTTPVSSFLDVSAALQSGGRFALSRTQLDQLAGGRLADGSHTLHLQAADAAGNVAPVFDLTFTLDTQPPALPIQDPPPDTLTTRNVTVTGHTTDALSGVAALQAQVDGGAFADVAFDGAGNYRFATTLPLTGAADGTHTVGLRATDRAGNVSALSAVSLTLDTTAPHLVISSPTAALTTNANVTITGQVSDNVAGVATLEAQLDGGTASRVAVDPDGTFRLPLTLPLDGTADGPHTVRFQATDRAGNATAPVTVSFTLDATAPVVVITSPADGSTTRSNVTVTGRVTDNLSGVATLQAQLDVGLLQDVPFDDAGNCTFATTLPTDGSADGMHTVLVQATDKAGNISNVATVSFVFDAAAPVVVVSSPAPGVAASTNVTVAGQATDNVSGVASLEAQVDGGPFSAVPFDGSGNFSFPTAFPLDGSADGAHTVTLRATDRAGNVSALTPVSFTLDSRVTLREQTNFRTAAEQTFTIPDQPSLLTFTFSDPAFDTSATGAIKDAFEAALVDANGQPLVHTIANSRDAFFNLTEEGTPSLGAGTTLDGHTMSANLAGVTPGTTARLVFRLVNNDGDVNTSALVPRAQFVANPGGQPVDATPAALASAVARTVDFSSLADVSAGVTAAYGQTSFDDGTNVLYADLALSNTGRYAAGAPLVVAVTHLSDPSVRVRDADGRTPDGLPYYDFSALAAGGTLSPGQVAGSRPLAFFNPNRVPFTYDLVVLGQLNRAPHFTSTPGDEVLAERTYTYAPAATDADGDPLAFTLVAAPDAVQFDGKTGKVTWTPTRADAGAHTITLRVDDGRGGSDVQTYAVTVDTDMPDRPPVILSSPEVDGNVGAAYTYAVTATDADGDPVTYALTTAPAGMTLDPASGLIRWTPAADQTGDQVVAVQAADGRGGTATQTFVVAVAGGVGNHAPTIISDPVTQAAADRDYTYDVDAVDPDNDPLSYALTKGPAGMTIDSATGVIRFQPGSDFLTPGTAHFADDTFNDTDWSTLVLQQDQGGTGSAMQILTGGNPGSYRQMSASVNGRSSVDNQSQVLVYSGRTDAVYDPRVSGPVGTIDFSQDIQGNPHTVGIALRQNGKVFVSFLTQSPSGGWFTQSAKGLGAENFERYRDSAANSFTDEQPDFSATGAPIEFGSAMLVLNSPTGGPNSGFVEIDNWSVTVHPVPSAPVSVEVADGRGGKDHQDFTLEVRPPARIQGVVFNDENGNGAWDRRADLVIASGGGTGSLTRFDPLTGIQIDGAPTIGARVALGPDGAYYSVGFSQVVFRFDPATDQRTIFAQGAGLHGAEGLAFGPDGNLYVGNEGTGDVSRFDGKTGQFLGTFFPNSVFVGFSSDLAFGPDGNLYVSSLNFGTTSRFDFKTGALMTTYGGRSALTFGPDGMLYTTGWGQQVFRFNPLTGQSLGVFAQSNLFSRADGLAFGPDGNLYVSDIDNDRILRFDGHTGAFLGVFAQFDQTQTPEGLLMVPRSTTQEPGLAGVTVFLDQNANGRLDPGELSTTTDANGHYVFDDLPPGTYHVVQVPLAGFVRTAPPEQTFDATVASAATAFQVDFGNHRDARTTANDQPPHFTSTPPTAAAVGQPLVYRATATDPDGDLLTFDLTARPDGMAVDPLTGAVTWTPRADQRGQQTITLSVTDGLKTDTQTFTITVASAGSGPGAIRGVVFDDRNQNGVFNQRPDRIHLVGSTRTAAGDLDATYVAYAVADDFSLSLLDQQPSGIPGDDEGERIAAAPSATGSDVFLDDYLAGRAAVLNYHSPVQVAPATPGWQTFVPAQNQGGDAVFVGISATAGAVYASGYSSAFTVDNVGDKEPKAFTASLSAADGGINWARQTPPAPGAFPYGGYEFGQGGTSAVENGQVFVYTSGYSQRDGGNNGRFFLVKLDAAGNVVWLQTDGTTPGNRFTMGRALVEHGGFVYVAGFNNPGGGAGQLGAGRLGHLWKFSLAGALVWERDGAAGDYYNLDVDPSTGDLYATGQADTGGGTAGMLVERWNPNGDLVWSRVFEPGTPAPPSVSTYASGVAVFPDRLLIAASHQRPGAVVGVLEGLVLELDPGTGALARTTAWDEGSFSRLEDIVAVPPETGLAGQTVYLDANGNGVRDPGELSTVTNAGGSYAFTGLVPGTYPVRLENAPGFLQTAPQAQAYTLTIAGGQETYDGIDFGATAAAAGSISGTVFNDQNGDGSPAGDLPLAGRTAYLDSNGDGQREDNEPSIITDASGNYAFAGLPAGHHVVALEPLSGQVQTAPAAPGTYVIDLAQGQTLTGRDFGARFDLSTAPNRPPHFTSTPPTDATVGHRLVYKAKALDPNADPLTFDLVVKPAGMVVDPQRGVVVWTPQPDQLGGQDVILRVADGQGGMDLQAFHLTVGSPNTAPVITSTPGGPAAVGVPFEYAVRAQDAENDPLTFALGAAPAGMVIDPKTGRITWTPSADQVGDQVATVRVADSHQQEASQPFTVTVTASPANHRPVITSSPRTATGLAQPYLYLLHASDPDGDPLTVTLDVAPPEMTFDPATGALSWQPTGSQLGPNAVRLRVADNRGEEAVQAFTITVVSGTVNRPPSIISAPPLAGTVGRPLTYDAVAEDLDGDPVFWSLAVAPAGMSVDPVFGFVRWTPADDQAGPNTVTLVATDPLGGSATQAFTIRVRAADVPPTMVTAPPTQAAVGRPFGYTPRVLDPDGGPPTFTLAQAPAGMTIDPTTGQIVWTPSADELGPQAVVLRVDDGAGGSALQAFTVVVSETLNRPPVITSTPPLKAAVRFEYTYQVTATDPDGGPLTFSLQDPPAGMLLDRNTGLLDWVPQPGQDGHPTVTVVVQDDAGATATQSFTLDVAAHNAFPVLNGPPRQSVAPGQLYRFDIPVTDPDGDALTFHLDRGPTGMTADALGRITWQTTVADLGTHPVAITISDGRGGDIELDYDLTVTADTQAPRVQLEVSADQVTLGSEVTFVVTAADDTGVRTLGLTLDGVPLALDANGRATQRLDRAGVFDAVATATDAGGLSSSARHQIQVTDPRDTAAPTVDITSPADGAAITTFTDVVGTVDDDNLVSYTLAYAPVDSDAFVTFGGGTAPVVNGVLGRFDPTMLQNDSYVIRLTATDAGGNVSTVEQTVGVMGNLKLGNFRLSFTDLSVPVSGVPITVTRTYDTLTADEDGDVGFGWRLAVRDVRLRTTVPSTEAEADGLFNPYQEQSRVTLTLPDGSRQGFTFQPFERFSLFGLRLFQPRFVADPGVTSTLTVEPFDLSRSDTGEFFGLAAGGLPYNPADAAFGGRFTLTTQAGLRYEIDGLTGGLRRATDRNGNTLTYTDAGVFSSTGAQVTFGRDARGRIVSVTDPAGKQVRYAYDAGGDLVAVTDRDGNVTRLVYSPVRAHYLERVVDPLGRTGVRTEYDASGRLTQVVDATGQAVSLGQDLAQSQETVVDALGHPTTFAYDARGNVIAVTDARGGVTRRTYDANDDLLSQTDPLGNTTTYTYDDRRNLLTRTDPLGNTSRYTYEAFGQLATATDALGRTITNTFDSQGNRLTLTDPAGGVSRFSYDDRGDLTSWQDANGSSVSLTYDATGQMTSFTDAEGTTSVVTNDALGNLLTDQHTLQTADGPVPVAWSYTYNAGGQVTGVAGPDGSRLQIDTDPTGQYRGETDPLGNRSVFEYDDAGRPTARVAPDGTVLRVQRDALGQETAVVLPGGGQLTHEYDALGQVVASTDATGGTVRQEYDADGRRTATTDPAGRVVRYTYDAAGRLVQEEAPGGAVTHYAYDAAGQLTAVTDANAQTTRLERDALGRVTRTTFADGSTSVLTYDGSGRVLTRTTPSGGVWRYTYSPAGLLEGVTDPAGNETRYGHDSHGNTDHITDALGRQAVLVFDTLGRLVRQTLPGGETETRAYDAAGRLVSVTDFAGQTTRLEYDVNGRPVRRLNADGTFERLTYDADGNVVAAEDARGATQLTRDAAGRVVTFTGPGAAPVRYTYNPAGQVTAVTTDAGTTTFTYTDRGELATVGDPAGTETTYTRDLLGRPVQTTLPTGNTITRSYDVLGRTLRVTYASPSGQPLYDLVYTRDGAGRVTRLEESTGRVTAYQYDALDRVTEERTTLPGGATRVLAYAYDARGNLTRRTEDGRASDLTYDADDRLLSDGTRTYTWDGDGNLASWTDGATTETFTYDSRGRLTGVRRTGGDPTTITYEYDFDGLLAARTVNGVRTTFVWDRAASPFPQLVEERDAAGAVLVRFGHDDRGLTQVRTAAGTSFLVTDHLGTVRAVARADGTLDRTLAFDAYGVPEGGLPEEIGFTGAFTDPGTGLVYLRGRWYAPDVARFIQPDPADGNPAFTDTLNRYVYSLDDPVNRSDPSGRFGLAEVSTVSSVVGILAGLALSNSPSAQELIATRLLKFGPFSFQNFSAFVYPFLSVNANTSGLGPLPVSLSATAGLELLYFPSLSQPALFGYFGAGLQLAGAASFGVSLNLAQGYVFDTPTPDKYTGYFVSVTLSFSGLTKTTQEILNRISLAPSLAGVTNLLGTPPLGTTAGFSAFFSPTVTYTDNAGNDRYSNGFTPLSTSFTFGTTASASQLAGFNSGKGLNLSLTYYYEFYPQPSPLSLPTGDLGDALGNALNE